MTKKEKTKIKKSKKQGKKKEKRNQKSKTIIMIFSFLVICFQIKCNKRLYLKIK